MDQQRIIDNTQRWIASIVIGLNLCPFAQRVFDKIRYVVSAADETKKLLQDLEIELQFLASAAGKEVETSLLIHPDALQDFFDYNDFLDDCDECLQRLGLSGIIQIASFHPQYQFAETEPGDVENYTNRSPYPMLHLLRESSITQVAGDPDLLAEIPERNIQTLRTLGKEKVLQILKSILK